MALAISEKLKSRKLWLASIAAAVAFGNGMWDWGLTFQQVLTIITPLMLYVGVEGLIDGVRAEKSVKP